jgi:deoxycytidylate deaminase
VPAGDARLSKVPPGDARLSKVPAGDARLTTPADDARCMAAALALARRGAGRTGANPNVGCLIVADGRIVGRGWTAAVRTPRRRHWPRPAPRPAARALM